MIMFFISKNAYNWSFMCITMCDITMCMKALCMHVSNQ